MHPLSHSTFDVESTQVVILSAVEGSLHTCVTLLAFVSSLDFARDDIGAFGVRRSALNVNVRRSSAFAQLRRDNSTAATVSPTSPLTLVNGSPSHHEHHTSYSRNVFHGIAVEGDNIGCIARRDGTDGIPHPHRFRRQRVR
jgi:hypothetical protein